MKRDDESFEEFFHRKEMERLRAENAWLREQLKERGLNPNIFLRALNALRKKNRLTI